MSYSIFFLISIIAVSWVRILFNPEGSPGFFVTTVDMNGSSLWFQLSVAVNSCQFWFSLLMRFHKIEIIPCRFFSASLVSLLVHIVHESLLVHELFIRYLFTRRNRKTNWLSEVCISHQSC